MILPYFWKLLCLCLTFFFLVHTVLGLAAWVASPAAIRLAERLRARAAARFLFAFRVFPLALALFAVLALCVPGYLWFEPEATGERVGWACIVAALVGAASWAMSGWRAFRAVASSVQFRQQCRQAGREVHLRGQSASVLIVEHAAPLFVVAGVVGPQVILSRGALRALSTEQLDAALQHEHAHLVFHDNFKRLLLLLSPDVFPLSRAYSSLERSWVKFSEWAADDDATEGDANRSVLLAGALVRLARMGGTPPVPALAASLLPGDQALATRVDRLLHPGPPPAELPLGMRTGLSASLLMAGSVAVVIWGASLPLASVHGLLERLIR